MSDRPRFSVLDIGAGYGWLAHRMTQAYPELSDYCCVDAIPEATLTSSHFRGQNERDAACGNLCACSAIPQPSSPFPWVRANADAMAAPPKNA
jgi:hypothetical protein